MAVSSSSEQKGLKHLERIQNGNHLLQELKIQCRRHTEKNLDNKAIKRILQGKREAYEFRKKPQL